MAHLRMKQFKVFLWTCAVQALQPETADVVADAFSLTESGATVSVMRRYHLTEALGVCVVDCTSRQQGWWKNVCLRGLDLSWQPLW